MARPNNKVTKQSQFDFILFITVLVMLGFGLVMVLSASSPSALSEGKSSYAYVTTQAISAGIGIIAMLFISKIDYRKWAKFSKIAYIASIGLLLAVLIPGLKYDANGATRWIKVPGLSTFQPSELVKIAMIIFFAKYLTDNKGEIHTFFKGFICPLLWIAPIIAILIFVQSHLSASVIIGMVVVILMLMAGTKMKYFITVGTPIAGVGVATLYILAKYFEKGAYRLARITSFMDPWADPTGDGWQVIQSLYAIGSGGLFGVGLGNSTQKYLYLPEPQNDFIFSVIAEELGFVGCLAVIILFGIFIWRGVLIAMKAPDSFGSLVAIGITSLIGLQAIINIAVVTSSMPNTGMPLPFFSYGGTALLILLCAVGILLNISRYQKQ
ncbi:MAG: putative lipid II flippase FtsW [Clostridia bacterium]|nr:putative lipid II flippase FtsW [Clostridia bacterium]